MVFSSLTFLFIFLPLVLLFYYLSDKKYRNAILLVFSLFFYSWGEPHYIILMICSIIFNYFLAVFIDKTKKGKNKRALLIFTIMTNILVLFIFKYLGFFMKNVNMIIGNEFHIYQLALPIGISFYTFQILSYIIDVYKKKVKVQKNIIYLGMYISFFPQLIAGPIVRYSDIVKQIENRKTTIDSFCNGFRRFICGFIKKVIIANNAALVADLIFNSYSDKRYGAIILLLGVLSYTIQIYFDFSGYSDMAIGLGKLFGFDFLENFNYPYVARSITDFWRRWHISLSGWFRDYVYIPLGGNRCKKIRWIFNMFVVWVLTGLWHGASWNFILWGLFYFSVLIIEKNYTKKYLDKLPKILSWLTTFITVNIGWLIFRVESLRELLSIIKSIITFKHSDILTFILENYYQLNSILYVILGLIFMFPVLNIFKKYENNKKYMYIKDIVMILLFVFAIITLINDSYNPFIYFRF